MSNSPSRQPAPKANPYAEANPWIDEAIANLYALKEGKGPLTFSLSRIAPGATLHIRSLSPSPEVEAYRVPGDRANGWSPATDPTPAASVTPVAPTPTGSTSRYPDIIVACVEAMVQGGVEPKMAALFAAMGIDRRQYYRIYPSFKRGDLKRLYNRVRAKRLRGELRAEG
jgi:hypothetical protein